MCWQTTAALWGPTSSVCACAGTSTASALYSTIAETPSQSACAYSATSDLPATIPLTPTPICTAITLSSTPRSTVCGCAPASTASITSSYSTISGAPTQSACAFMASSDLGPPIPEPTNLIDITCWSQPYNKATESCEGTPVGSYYAQDLTANTPCFNVPDCECISATYWGLAIVTWNHLNCYGGSSGKGMTERIGPSCSSHVYGNASMPGTNSWGFWPGCKWYQ